MRCSADRPCTSNTDRSPRTRWMRLSSWTRPSADCDPDTRATPVLHGRSRPSARSTTRSANSASITSPSTSSSTKPVQLGVLGELVAVLVGVEADDRRLEPQRQVLGDDGDGVALGGQVPGDGEDAVVVVVGGERRRQARRVGVVELDPQRAAVLVDRQRLGEGAVRDPEVLEQPQRPAGRPTELGVVALGLQLRQHDDRAARRRARRSASGPGDRRAAPTCRARTYGDDRRGSAIEGAPKERRQRSTSPPQGHQRRPPGRCRFVGTWRCRCGRQQRFVVNHRAGWQRWMVRGARPAVIVGAWSPCPVACSAPSPRGRPPPTSCSTSPTWWPSSTPDRCSAATRSSCHARAHDTMLDLDDDLLAALFVAARRVAAARRGGPRRRWLLGVGEQPGEPVGAPRPRPRRPPHEGRRAPRVLLAQGPLPERRRGRRHRRPPTRRPRLRVRPGASGRQASTPSSSMSSRRTFASQWARGIRNRSSRVGSVSAPHDEVLAVRFVAELAGDAEAGAVVVRRRRWSRSRRRGRRSRGGGRPGAARRRAPGPGTPGPATIRSRRCVAGRSRRRRGRRRRRPRPSARTASDTCQWFGLSSARICQRCWRVLRGSSVGRRVGPRERERHEGRVVHALDGELAHGERDVVVGRAQFEAWSPDAEPEQRPVVDQCHAPW